MIGVNDTPVVSIIWIKNKLKRDLCVIEHSLCAMCLGVGGLSSVKAWPFKCWNYFTKHRKCICTFIIISQRIDGTGSWIFFLVEDKDPLILHSQYHCCWWPGNARSQGISNHGIDLFLPEFQHLDGWRPSLLVAIMTDAEHTLTVERCTFL